RVRARVLSTGGAWSAMEDAVFTLDTSTLKVTELNYHPAPPPAGSPYTADDFEFIELFNAGTTALNLSSSQFTLGVTYTFPAGTTLGAGQRAVLVKNPVAFQSRYGNAISILGTYSGKFSDDSEEVNMIGAAGQTIFD